MRRIVRQSISEESEHLSIDESPLKPWIIERAHSVLLFKTVHTSCVYGRMKGTGILIKRYL